MIYGNINSNSNIYHVYNIGILRNFNSNIFGYNLCFFICLVTQTKKQNIFYNLHCIGL